MHTKEGFSQIASDLEDKMEHLEKQVIAARSGDRKAFETIYMETYKSVYFTCISLLKNEKDAEDVSQEVYLTVLKNLHTLEDPAKIKPWISRIAVNKCKNLLKKEKPVLMGDEIMEDFRTETDELLLPEEYVTNKAKRKIVMDIMKEELSEVQYRTVILFYFNGLSIPEIAEMMECPTGTVTYRLSVARERIKAGVEGYEKKSGEKLYSFALVPILVSLFTTEAMAMEPPNLCAKIWETASEMHGAVGVAAKTGGKTVLKSMKSKVLAGALSVALVGGGITAAVMLSNPGEHEQERYEDDEKDLDRDEDNEDENDEDQGDEENRGDVSGEQDGGPVTDPDGDGTDAFTETKNPTAEGGNTSDSSDENEETSAVV